MSQTTEYDQSESEPSTWEQSSTHSAIVQIQPRPQPQSSSPDLFLPEHTVATWLVVILATWFPQQKQQLKFLVTWRDCQAVTNSLCFTIMQICLIHYRTHITMDVFVNLIQVGGKNTLGFDTVLGSMECFADLVLYSLLTLKRSDRSCLINKSFSNWVKLGNTLSKHSKLSYHQDSVAKADSLMSTVENPSSRVDVMTNRVVQQQMKDNNHLLHQIVWAILFLARQGLALRGDKEYNTDSKTNQGYLLALLKLFSQNNPLLHSHLHSPRAKNATYLSPKVQIRSLMSLVMI